MPVTVVVGGQYGSEGKGKIVAYLAKRDDVAAVVRCGGPNAGHSFEWRGTKYSLRQIPSGLINPETRLYLAPGSVVNPAVLLEEIDKYKVERGRVRIDPCSAVVTDQEISAEKYLKLRERIGSTLSGTGATTAKKVLRHEGLRLARDVRELDDLLGDVALELNELLSQGKRVFVEGTQGFGLSLYHGGHYPYATSRDVSASGVLSEAGIGPLHVDEIIMVIRTFPIRVAGDSGPLPNEISWGDLSRESGYPFPVEEYGAVTGRLRRVARFDASIVRRAATVNRPTQIALTGADYLDYANSNARAFDDLTAPTKDFITNLEGSLDLQVTLIGTGPDLTNIVDRREGSSL
jgi:adenylosuccinate synthase